MKGSFFCVQSLPRVNHQTGRCNLYLEWKTTLNKYISGLVKNGGSLKSNRYSSCARNFSGRQDLWRRSLRKLINCWVPS